MKIRLLICFLSSLLLTLIGLAGWSQELGVHLETNVSTATQHLIAQSQDANTEAPDQDTATIYQIDIGGAQLRPLASNLDQDWYLNWSPDGRQVAVSAPQGEQQNGHHPLFVMNVDGTQRRQITSELTISSNHVAWSPDSNRMAAISGPGDNQKLYVFDLEEDPVINLLQDAEPFYSTLPAWLPDGQYLAYNCVRRMALCTIRHDGQERQNLSGTGNFPSSFQWSPDGEKLAYTVSLGNDTYVVVRNLSDESSINLSSTLRTGLQDYSPTWSPDSQRIAFSASLNGEPGSIWTVVNADGTNPIPLIRGGSDMSWSPDGERLAFVADGELWRINADGTAPTQVTDLAATQQMVRSFCWLADSQHWVFDAV